MSAIAELADTDFDTFLAAVKLLADAARTSVDFDDFALHFERAHHHPLYDDTSANFLYNLKNALETGLENITQLMEIANEDREYTRIVGLCLDDYEGGNSSPDEAALAAQSGEWDSEE